jgi:hypothetical protein
MKAKYLFLLIFVPFFVSAHGAVTTLTKVSGEYTLEFEYNTLGSIVAGEYTFYATYLLDNQNKNVDFDTAFIRIAKKEGQIVLASTLGRNDLTGFAGIGTILDQGIYSSSINFYKEDKELAAAEFEFEVVDSDKAWYKNSMFQSLGMLIVGLLAGSCGVYLLKRKNHGSQS